VDWLKPVIDWVKNSIAVAVTASIASALFVFTPLSAAVSKYQPWPLVIFVVSTIYVVILVTGAIGTRAIKSIKRKLSERRHRQMHLKSISGLSAQERDLLRSLIGRGIRTIPKSRLAFEMATTADELVRQNILRRNGNWLTEQNITYTVEEWAWQYLHERPEILDF
jgi:superinfection exclusion protein B